MGLFPPRGTDPIRTSVERYGDLKIIDIKWILKISYLEE
jgi:hypothetical protein